MQFLTSRHAVAVALLLTSAGLRAQTVFPFSIDQDNLHGAPDFSYLNHPLTAADRILVKNGHFYTKAGQRVRFFGMNLAFGANFPTQDDATRIARRLRRLGVNLVRLHHMDSSPDFAATPSTANSILVDSPYPTFNDISVERLRDFLNALSAEGIYADLNLHVGYQFRPSVDQVPSLPGMPIPSQSKPLNIFYPRMVQLEQSYAQQLITRLQLQNDPVLAMVEINNESSLLQAWQNGELDPVLAGEYRAALQTGWNQWLGTKYHTTDALLSAWGTGTDDGPNILGGKWTLEQGHGKVGTLTMIQTDGLPTAQVQPGTGSGWLFLKQTGFHLTAGVRYVWTFDARADVAAGQSVATPTQFMRDVSPWDGFSSPAIQLTNQWQTFAIAVTPSYDIPDSGRVSLDVEYAPGNVYARNMNLVQAGQRSLAAGESIEAANISLIAPNQGATPARLADYVSFLIATDRAFVTAMRDTVRAATDPLVPITGTQMGYGGLALLDSQDGLDYQDNHFYIDHYAFPNVAWDGFDWSIRDASASDGGWPAFLDMAWSREAGRPYTVSEYNQPWPNTHGAEIDPSLAAFAAFQDWDAIMHFAYSHGRNWDDGVPNGFNINGDWTKFPNVGQAAWIFRTGAVDAGSAAVSVPVSAAERLQAAESAQAPGTWVVKQAGIPRETAYTRRVELVKDGAGDSPKPPFDSDTRQLSFDTATGQLVVNAPRAAAVLGRLGTAKTTAGAMDVQVAGPAAAVLLTPLDQAPLALSRSMLLSIPGYALRSLPAPGNRQPDARSAEPQNLVNYRGTTDTWTLDPTNSPNPSKPSGDMNGGWQPTYIERVEGWITLHTHARNITVSALDGAGNVVADLPSSEVQAVAGGFVIHVNGAGQVQSAWFTIRTAAPRRTGRRF